MTGMTFPHPEADDDRGPLPFPAQAAAATETDGDIADEALAAVEHTSRKLEDLARALNCLGFFDDDDDDRPRAA